MKRVLSEPLFHFVLIGAALFVVYSMRAGPDAPADDEIVVSAGTIEHLATLFSRTWQRPPTEQELEGLIDDYVREEAAYREAMALGLDRDDTIIRRRLRQKLEFIAEDTAGQLEPTDDELAAYLVAHEDDYRIEPRLTFRHVYLNPETRGARLESDARTMLNELNSNEKLDASAMGDRILLVHGYSDAAVRDIANLFGQEFAAAIVELESGVWHGPVRSGYGVHLVRVNERTEGRVPELDEVRRAVRRDLENARRREAMETFYGEMLDRYNVTVEWPAAGPETGNE